ncbi:MAG: hypothetical protein ACRD4G_18795, partial [Bryobacteraceae bacterium]
MYARGSRASRPQTLDDNPWIALLFFAFLLLVGLGTLSIRYHIRLMQWLEFGIDLSLLAAAIWLAFSARKLDRNRNRQPFRIPAIRDEREVTKAAAQDAVLLGYTLDKSPLFWTDRTRTMQAVACGMNGAGKSTLLENIVGQDLQRV